jgi:osmotically-inducible protein OsmY/sporulation protein YlmC with PRC-barrel domain
MVEPRWEVKIGSTVAATDGEYGRLQQLLLDPHQERIVALLVRPYGLVPSHPVVVPEEAIADASETEVRLKISREQMEALPQYWPGLSLVVEDRKYEANDELFAVRGNQGIEVGRAPGAREPGMIEIQPTGFEREHLGLRLHAGQHVFCRDGHAGWVSLILLDPSGRAKSFVVHAGRFHLTGRKLIVPSAWIQEVDRENVHLSVEKHDLKNLPEYYPDDVLGAAVDQAIWSDEILRNTDYKELGISVEDGIVRLRGHVGTPRNKKTAEDAARSVPGVLDLENDLVVDQDLVTNVAQALGKNELTRPERISVGAQHGFVTLNGRVGSAAIREAAGAIAASVPQVRGVINELQAPDAVIDPEEHQIQQPRIGREVYAADMQLGQVERVIIDPHTRRVTAFVARGCFPDPRNKDNYRLPDEGSKQEKSVVIPIEAVRCTTSSIVLLEVSGVDAALYRSFEPADFTSPATDWQPPYPYRWEQVLFGGQRLEE